MLNFIGFFYAFLGTKALRTFIFTFGSGNLKLFGAEYPVFDAEYFEDCHIRWIIFHIEKENHSGPILNIICYTHKNSYWSLYHTYTLDKILLPGLFVNNHLLFINLQGGDKQYIRKHNNREINHGNFLINIGKILKGHRHFS